nr:ring-h2 finger protein atl47 [Quercus suber]
MGTFQYVVDDSNLQVALFDGSGIGDGGSNVKHVNERGYLAIFSDGGDVQGKKISGRKGECFSVSKIWLWSKKSGFHMDLLPFLNASIPINNDETHAL